MMARVCSMVKPAWAPKLIGGTTGGSQPRLIHRYTLPVLPSAVISASKLKALKRVLSANGKVSSDPARPNHHKMGKGRINRRDNGDGKKNTRLRQNKAGGKAKKKTRQTLNAITLVL